MDLDDFPWPAIAFDSSVLHYTRGMHVLGQSPKCVQHMQTMKARLNRAAQSLHLAASLIVHLMVQVHNPHACTSGRRLHAWGGLHATAVHFIIGLSWYLGASPQQMQDIYARLYTDNYR